MGKLILKKFLKGNYFKNLYILIDFTALSRLHKKYSTSFIEQIVQSFLFFKLNFSFFFCERLSFKTILLAIYMKIL